MTEAGDDGTPAATPTPSGPDDGATGEAGAVDDVDEAGGRSTAAADGPDDVLPAPGGADDAGDDGAGDDDGTGDAGDDGPPMWARVAGFVVTLLVLVGLVVVVLMRDNDRATRASTSGATAVTVALPADNGGGPVTTTTSVPTPADDGPTTIAHGPRTNDEVALGVEEALRRASGFTYKASCRPDGPVARDEVLECSVATEPVVKEAPPGSVVVVVVDDQGHFIWNLAPGDTNTLDALRSEPNLSCDDLAGRNKPWTYVLAYWLANDRPAALDPGGTGRPCDGRYNPSDIDQTLAAAM